MSFTIHGIGISDGIAIGRAHLLSHAYSEVAHYEVDVVAIDSEIKRFDKAITKARNDLLQLKDRIPRNSPTEFEAFIKLHLLILDDPILSEAPKTKITELLCNAEWALKLQLETLLEKFLAIKDDYLSERRNDIIQVVERVLRILYGEGENQKILNSDEKIIIVAHDISPAELIQYKNQNLTSFITDVGGTTSHTAIIARSLNVPSIVALHDARQLIREGDKIIVDGTNGVVMVAPHKKIVDQFKQKKIDIEKKQKILHKLKKKPSITKDGVKIDLLANIELPSDTEQAINNGAEGIGLFRTEFLYLGRGDLPTEEEQYITYKNAVLNLNGKSLIIRTFDLGADKHTEQLNRPMAPNPALGLRAIRLCLAEPEMFRHQIRAILRASNHGSIKILIPMLMDSQEIDQTLDSIKDAKNSLENEKIMFDKNIELGAMIEVPAAALAINIFLEKFDFFSVGTNDLIQYTLAVDRTDDSVSQLYNPLHPAILQLLSRIVLAAKSAGKPIAVCGEMAGDVSLTRLLLGLGLRTLSMHPTNLLQIKNIIMQTNISKIKPLIRKIISSNTSHEDQQLLINSINKDITF